MGGLLPQEYLYYSEHTEAPGQGELNCALRNTFYAAAFIFLRTSAAHTGKPGGFCPDDTNTLTYRTNRSEGVLHP